MKPVALLTILLSLLTGSTIALGQGFRGSPGRSSAGPGFSASTTSQTRDGAVFGSPGAAPARGLSPAQSLPQVAPQGLAPPPHSGPAPLTPGAQKPGSPHIAAQRLAPYFSAPVRVFPTPGPNHARVPAVAGGWVPHHHLRPWAFPRYPGIVVLDVPYFEATTVITQVAPGVVREERRYAENPPSDARVRDPGRLAPFDPTPPDVVERMLALATLKPDDVLYDLGAGDGRVAIAAAKKYRIKAVGFEIDPGLVKLARENVRKQGLEHWVEIRQQDFLSADLSPASVVTLYLSDDGNLAVRPQLMRQLKAGARVISYTFDMGEWQAKIAERYRDAGGESHMIYLWQIGEPLAFR